MAKAKAPRGAKTHTQSAGGHDAAAFASDLAALPPSLVKPSRLDGDLAHHNVNIGLVAYGLVAAEVPSHLPKIKRSLIERLPAVALAFQHAATAATQVQDPKVVRAHLSEALRLRGQALSAAEAAAQSDVIPAKPVAQIRAGKGPFEHAKDCVSLADLFAKYAKELKGKTPITAAQLTRLRELGNQLLGELRPEDAKTRAPVSKDQLAADDRRDRLAVLLIQGFDELWKVGAYFHGQDVAEHVPPLQARRHVAAVDAVDPPVSEPTEPTETQPTTTEAAAKVGKKN